MFKTLVAIPLLLTLTACGALENETSATRSIDNGPSYLALGDSISFGYNPLVPYTEESVKGGMFPAYSDVVAERSQFTVTNSSCPGETTSSFIDMTKPDYGCRTVIDGEFPAHDHLKVDYSGSQLDYAVEFLKAHPDTQLVSLTLGGNDILIVEHDCEVSKYPTACKIARAPALLAKVAVNVTKIIHSLRATQYQGPIIFVTNYARNYKEPVQNVVLSTFQAEIRLLARKHGFIVASGYDVFKKAVAPFNGDSCEAGLLIKLEDGTCNQHPSRLGRELLGQAVLDALK